MTTYAYTYEVLSTNPATKEMTLRYISSGRQTVDVTVGLPKSGQTLAAVAARSAPLYVWEQAEQAFETVVPGMSGSGATAPTTLVIPGIPFQQFYGLFTNAERTALIGATQTDVQTKRRYDELWMLGLVSPALPEVELLLSRLVTLGIIDNTRKAAIIAAIN